MVKVLLHPVNCKGPEEVVPGQVQDTLDIQVYERPNWWHK